jgi:iron complex transport system substrate-binding protein
MPRGVSATLLVAMAALVSSTAMARPLRVMSLNECTDQLVLALLPPSQITSVTWLSRDPSLSVMVRAAGQVPINHGAAEEVLRDRPDLVIASTYATPATRALLKKLHYPLLELSSPDSFEDIRRDTRQIAAAVGATARGEALIAAMDATLRQLSLAKDPALRVAAWDGAGFSAQPGSMYDALLRAAGAHNVANDRGVLASGAPDVETLLAIAPDLLIRGEPGSEPPGRRTDVVNNPVVLRVWGSRTVVVPQYDYVCGTPFSAAAALELRQEMLATLRRARGPVAFKAAP